MHKGKKVIATSKDGTNKIVFNDANEAAAKLYITVGAIRVALAPQHSHITAAGYYFDYVGEERERDYNAKERKKAIKLKANAEEYYELLLEEYALYGYVTGYNNNSYARTHSTLTTPELAAASKELARQGKITVSNVTRLVKEAMPCVDHE